MRRAGAMIIAAVAIGAVAGACSRSPRDAQADAIAKDAHTRADVIRKQAEAQAHALQQQAATLSAQARQAGGYTGERLKVQADAAAREADIVMRQGRDQAQAAAQAGDAQAKAIRSR